MINEFYNIKKMRLHSAAHTNMLLIGWTPPTFTLHPPSLALNVTTSTSHKC